MDALEAIGKRRSVRRYTGEPIPREQLLQIVDAGRLAASGNNRQPWEFIVVTDRVLIDAVESGIPMDGKSRGNHRRGFGPDFALVVGGWVCGGAEYAGCRHCARLWFVLVGGIHHPARRRI